MIILTIALHCNRLICQTKAFFYVILCEKAMSIFFPVRVVVDTLIGIDVEQ